MTRVVFYALTGVLVGAFCGLLGSALLNLDGFSLILGGGIVGVILGVAFAVYMNATRKLDRPFIQASDIEPLAVSAEITTRGILPYETRMKFVEWMRSKLEKLS